MYEALVEKVRYHIQKANFMGLKEAESTLLLNETANAIEKLLTERDKVNVDSWKTAFEIERDEHRWIPVEERLPEEHLGVLCYCSKNDQYGCGEWHKEDNGTIYWTGLYGMIPTHWMPLPQPPGVTDINVGDKEKI